MARGPAPGSPTGRPGPSGPAALAKCKLPSAKSRSVTFSGKTESPYWLEGPNAEDGRFAGQPPTRIRPSRYSAARSAEPIDRAILRMKMKLGIHRPQKRRKRPKIWERVDHDATQKRPPRQPQTRAIKARKPAKRAHEGSNGVPPARKSTALTVGRF